MRFFKPFKLLHRRTKSDPTNALISDFSEFKPTASSYEGISDALPTFAASEIHPSPHPNLRILDLEAENSHLRNISVASLKELSDVKLLLQATQADLYAELHRGVRQRKEDRIEIERLREILEQYETFLQLVVNAEPYGPESLADAHINLQGGHTLDQALSERAATTAEFIAGDHILTALGPRTQDEYTSAIKLTLTSRMQLRNYKKIAKFWKNAAKEDGKNPHIITPSTSAISSINEVLPAERRKAVNDLIARRRATAGSPFFDLILTPTREEKRTRGRSSESSAVSESAASELIPTHTSPHFRPRLSPLASQSLRKELDHIASTNRLSKWPYAHAVSRKPLSQIDLNMRNASSVTDSQPKAIEPSRASRKSKPHILHDGPGIPQQRKENKQRTLSDSTPNTSDAGYLGNVDKAQSHSLSSISEESEPEYESSSLSNVSSQEWITCDSHQEDTSFDSTTETLHDSPATPVSKFLPWKTEVSKSKLPIPVFRSLKRLSSTKLSAGKEKSAPTPGGDRTAVKASPTRLPVRSKTKIR